MTRYGIDVIGSGVLRDQVPCPGFIIELTPLGTGTARAEPEKLLLIRFLTFSCLNHAIWSWLIILLVQAEFFTASPDAIRSCVGSGYFRFADPVRASPRTPASKGLDPEGLAAARLQSHSRHPHLVGLEIQHHKKPAWVLATLADGSSVCGLFGSESFASSDPQDRDLYIQAVYRQNRDGEFQIRRAHDGILIRGDSIKHIEFWKGENDE